MNAVRLCCTKIDGARFDGQGRWHGGGPHGAAGPLKSALQKNVRLCRGHSAVRCGRANLLSVNVPCDARSVC